MSIATTDRIEKKILLKAPLERVWRAISDSQEFGFWFGMRLEGPFKPGARMRGFITPTKVNPEVAEMQKKAEGKPVELIVEQIEPQRLFSFRWHPHAAEPGVDYSNEPTTLITFALEQKSDGVLLTVTESGFDKIPIERRAQAFSANEHGWSLQLTNVQAYLAQAK